MSESTPAPRDGKGCSRCKLMKPIDAFGRSGSRWGDGRRSDCKPCHAAYARERRKVNPSPRSRRVFTPAHGPKKCNRCGNLKSVTEFGRQSDMSDGYRPSCKPCVAAASRERYRSVPAVQAYQKEYAADRQPEKRAYDLAYRERNRDRLRAVRAAWLRRNPDHYKSRREWRRAWREANSDRLAEQGRAWRAANPHVVREQGRLGAARRRARLRGLPVEPYTLDQLIARDGTTCVLCGGELDLDARRPDPRAPSIEHLECVSWPDSAGDVPSNVAISHYGCNISRQDKPHSAAARKRRELLTAEQSA